MAATALASITTKEHTFDVKFHPTESFLAIATISGRIELHNFDADAGSAELRRSVRSHKDSCRAACFLGDDASARLVSTSADCFVAMADVETGKRLWRAKLAAAGNALLPIEGNRVIAGDDDGRICVFDVREKKAVIVYEENHDFISDMVLGSDGRSLCATSGDGTLAIYDIRKNGVKGLTAMSDFQEDEFLSLAIVRSGTKVVCGSQTGVLCIFSWGDWGDQKDRIKGHPMSVDAMARVSEDSILTGSSDGKIRAVAVHNRELGSRVLGIVAEHGDLPVERLALSPCGGFFASASHGQPAVHLWSMEAAAKMFSGEDVAGGEGDGGGAGDSDVDSDDSDEPKAKKRRKKGKNKVANPKDVARKAAGGFFGDL